MSSHNVSERTLDHIEAILRQRTGSDNAITSSELSDLLGDLDHHDSTPKTRAAIRQLVHERGIPIAASNKGYYYIETEEELQQYVDDLSGRIKGIADRRDAVMNAFHEDP